MNARDAFDLWRTLGRKGGIRTVAQYNRLISNVSMGFVPVFRVISGPHKGENVRIIKVKQYPVAIARFENGKNGEIKASDLQ